MMAKDFWQQVSLGHHVGAEIAVLDRLPESTKSTPVLATCLATLWERAGFEDWLSGIGFGHLDQTASVVAVPLWVGLGTEQRLQRNASYEPKNPYSCATMRRARSSSWESPCYGLVNWGFGIVIFS